MSDYTFYVQLIATATAAAIKPGAPMLILSTANAAERDPRLDDDERRLIYAHALNAFAIIYGYDKDDGLPMTVHREPSAESIAEMPDITDARFRRRQVIPCPSGPDCAYCLGERCAQCGGHTPNCTHTPTQRHHHP